MNYSSVITLAQKLIKQPSDHNCQEIIINYLKTLNFHIELMCFDDTINIWAYHGDKKQHKNTLLFLGHTDVADPGNIQNWDYPPILRINT